MFLICTGFDILFVRQHLNVISWLCNKREAWCFRYDKKNFLIRLLFYHIQEKERERRRSLEELFRHENNSNI